MKFKSIILCIFLCFSLFTSIEANAQDSPDVGSTAKSDDAAHPALRGFAEFGMGTLFGTLTGGTGLLTGLFVKPTDLRPAMISAAILYPIGIGCGAILGGYLTDTKSSYWEPFVGAFSGALIADITAYYLSKDYPILSAVLVLILPLVTTVIAMETSHAWHEHEERRNDLRRTVMPLSFGFAF